MNAEYIFWPVLAQVFLTLVMFGLLGVRKARNIKAGLVDRRKAALDTKAWPEDVVKVSNNIANQFEVPVLFYVLCLVAWSLDAVSGLMLILASVFALSRYVHAWVHVGSNYVPMRLRLFLVGFLMVLLMLVLLVWHLATGLIGA